MLEHQQVLEQEMRCWNVPTLVKKWCWNKCSNSVLTLEREPWTAGVRALAQRYAAAAGLDPAEVGAKSFRIGGATDWRAVFGARAAEALIRQRGRWCSDVAAVYQRALADEHMSGSVAVGDADGAELETLCRGWSQPATFR